MSDGITSFLLDRRCQARSLAFLRDTTDRNPNLSSEAETYRRCGRRYSGNNDEEIQGESQDHLIPGRRGMGYDEPRIGIDDTNHERTESLQWQSELSIIVCGGHSVPSTATEKVYMTIVPR